jgi:hypothetical protein
MTEQYINLISGKIKQAFNDLNGQNLEILNDFYDETAVFEDPVGKASGLDEIKKYYAHVYKNVQSIKFDFREIRASGSHFYGHWIMTLQAGGLNGGKSFEVSGLSHLQFNERHKVIYHRDYLDLGSMLYERLPLVGALIRSIKSRLKH